MTSEEDAELMKVLRENRGALLKLLCPSSGSEQSHPVPESASGIPSFCQESEGVDEEDRFGFFPSEINTHDPTPFFVREQPYSLPQVHSWDLPKKAPAGPNSGWYLTALKITLKFRYKGLLQHTTAQVEELQDHLLRLAVGVVTGKMKADFFPYASAPIISRIMSLLIANSFVPSNKDEKIWELLQSNNSIIEPTATKAAESILTNIIQPTVQFGGSTVELKEVLDGGIQYLCRVLKLTAKRKGSHVQ